MDSAGSTQKDKTTIGLTVIGRSIAERIKQQEGLNDLLDVAIIGFGVAVRYGVGLGVARETSTTWNVGTFDNSGQLRDLVLALYDEVEAPYRQLEYLVSEGLEILAEKYEGAETSSRLTRVLHDIGVG